MKLTHNTAITAPQALKTICQQARLHPPRLPLLLLLLPSLLISSCKTPSEAVSAKKIDADSILAAFAKNSLPFEWLSARTRIHYQDKSQSKSFTAAIRMRKDSVIWISVSTLLGVEAARLLIKDDSVYLIDRLNKKYYAERLAFLQRYVPFPFDIGLMQRIVTGSALMPPSHRTSIKTEKNGYVIFSENTFYHNTINLNKDDLTISTEHLFDRQNDRSLSLTFDDYKNDSGRLFSYTRRIVFSGNTEGALSLRFSKVMWDEPQSFPFHKGARHEKKTATDE